jgi:hypothetical protein
VVGADRAVIAVRRENGAVIFTVGVGPFAFAWAVATKSSLERAG